MRDTRMEYGSEFDIDSSKPFITSAPSGLDIVDAVYYRSGRDALKALADMAGESYDTVLLPALCCESMILPFELKGKKTCFYKLRCDLKGNEQDVRSKLKPGTIFLYMRYFGIVPFSDEFLGSVRRDHPHVIMAEDRTHDIIIPRENEGFRPDVMLASVRKWSYLPEGGVLTARLPVTDSVSDRRFGDMRAEAMEKKSRYLRCWRPEVKQEFLHELSLASDILDEGPETVTVTPEYMDILTHTDFAEILRRRRENAALLHERIKPLEKEGKLRLLSDHPEDSTLYFCILIENRGQVQRAMAERNVYCPVIWPMPDECIGICENAQYAVDHMLAIPCDQRYGIEDMEYIASCLREVMN